MSYTLPQQLLLSLYYILCCIHKNLSLKVNNEHSGHFSTPEVIHLYFNAVYLYSYSGALLIMSSL